MAELNQWEDINYLKEMRDRVTFTFENRPVLDKYLQLMALPVEELEEVYRSLMQDRSIDTAVGKQLDIIGDIVGQPREILNVKDMSFFGYEGNPASEEYGDLNNKGVGGYYWDMNEPKTGSLILTDEIYRIYIKSKIIKNVTRATPEDIIRFIRFVFGTTRIQIVVDEGAHQMIILASSEMSQYEYTLLKYFVEEQYRSYFIPKALGVETLFGVASSDKFFSFLGVPGGSGYGTLNVVTGEVVEGGVYAELQ